MTRRGCGTCGGGSPVRPEGCAWWCARLVDDPSVFVGSPCRRLPENVGKRYPANHHRRRSTPWETTP